MLSDSDPVAPLNPPTVPWFPGALDFYTTDPDRFSADFAPEDELMAVCRELEGFMLAVLLKSMNSDFAGDTIFSKTYESSMYNEMFYYELANSIGKEGPGLGIAQTIYDDIILKTSGTIDWSV